MSLNPRNKDELGLDRFARRSRLRWNQFSGSGNREVLLVQAPVDSGRQIADSRSVRGRDGVVRGVPPAIETLTVGGQRLTACLTHTRV